jgi:hypothetical protein
MTPERDPDRLIHHFLLEGTERLNDQVYDEVRAVIEQRRQRVVIGPWRMPNMNRFVPIGVAAAAIIVVLVVGSQLLGPATPGGVGAAPTTQPTATAKPSPTATAAPSPAESSAWLGIPAGPYVISAGDDPLQATVDIASPGWSWVPDFDAVSKDDDGLDPPETVGATMLVSQWPAGTGFDVYGDPCHWSTTIPETPASTPDEIATALAAQASRDATTPVDVTVGGYAGKTLTLHVPMSYQLPEASREEEFASCDLAQFGSYAAQGDTEPTRNHQGPGQIDELWILDVDGAIVIIDAMYGPAAPADLVAEVRAIANSATFETR